MKTDARVLAILLLGASACSDPGPTQPEPQSAEGVIAESRQEVVTDDEYFASLDDQMPSGFGGGYFDEDGTLVVHVRDMTRSEDTRAFLASRFADSRGGELEPERIELRQAQFGFRELHTWRSALDASLPDGVTLTDVDDRLNRIRVGVASDEAILTVHQQLDEISVPDEARVVEVTGDIMLEKTVRDRFRPLRGGIELDWLSGTLCTMTAVGEHSTYGTVVLTNSHCGASIFTYNGGEDYHQDQINGYSRIGVEVLDPAPFSGGACPSGRICRWSDAQVIQVDDTVSTWQARLARTHLNSITINPADSTWTINHSDPTQFCFLTCIQTGSRADKVGKTTGWTSGTQNGQCVNVVAPGSNNVLLLCQATGTYHSAGGDSGSPVFQCGLVYCPDDVPVASVGVKGIHWGRFTTGAQDRIFSPTQYARLDIGGSGPCGGLLLASIYSFYC